MRIKKKQVESIFSSAIWVPAHVP